VAEHVRRRFWAWLVLAVGYLLSPVSWWNDAFVNIPIAYLLACAAALVHPRLFAPAMLVGYWLTNVAGLVMLHFGAARLAGARRSRLWVQLLVATAYTVLIAVLLATGILRPPGLGARH
jgi:hypothetical protein